MDDFWLVFLPGLSADHRLFEKQMEYFSKYRNCLVWDPPAHGESRPFDLDFTMDSLAGYLHRILQKEEIKECVLIGQSFGGYVAQAFISLFKGIAIGFVSIDSAPLDRRYYSKAELWLLLSQGRVIQLRRDRIWPQTYAHYDALIRKERILPSCCKGLHDTVRVPFFRIRQA